MVVLRAAGAVVRQRAGYQRGGARVYGVHGAAVQRRHGRTALLGRREQPAAAAARLHAALHLRSVLRGRRQRAVDVRALGQAAHDTRQ